MSDYDDFGLEPMDKVFARIRKEMDDMMRSFGKAENPVTFTYGRSVTIGPDGKPVVREFGTRPPKGTGRFEPLTLPAVAPVVDVMDDGDKITVVTEISKVTKDDISLDVKDNALRIKFKDNHIDVSLPAPVLLSGAKMNYNNGILEITVPKRKVAQK